MYLNTGLTSTKNYGKTILTKVSILTSRMCPHSTGVIMVTAGKPVVWIGSRPGDHP